METGGNAVYSKAHVSLQIKHAFGSWCVYKSVIGYYKLIDLGKIVNNEYKNSPLALVLTPSPPPKNGHD